jgi:hypothetical protein
MMRSAMLIAEHLGLVKQVYYIPLSNDIYPTKAGQAVLARMHDSEYFAQFQRVSGAVWRS